MTAGAILEVQDLKKHFTTKRGFPRSRTITVRAVDGVSFDVMEGEAFGLVGESGCGKSTVGRAVLRLIEPDSGLVRFSGNDVTDATSAELKRLRRELQMVFQDPYSSLDPKQKIGAMLAEPLRVHGLGTAAERPLRIEGLLREVGLPATAIDRYPHEFSGGQRQRLAIARALTVEPRFIVADEPVSALDVSIQAQILELLTKLMAERDLSCLFISHDLGVVRHFCKRLAVMYLGRIVETGPIPQIFEEPLHPYTQALKAASPVPDPQAKITLEKLEGEVASAADPPSGCHFHPRCPHVMPVCRETYPAWSRLGPDRTVACHLYNDKEGADR
ncbi:MAG: oligopeptide/dipeptide ABC transporter ATP-binding protein [Pseudomonadota bacterium]